MGTVYERGEEKEEGRREKRNSTRD